MRKPTTLIATAPDGSEYEIRVSVSPGCEEYTYVAFTPTRTGWDPSTETGRNAYELRKRAAFDRRMHPDQVQLARFVEASEPVTETTELTEDEMDAVIEVERRLAATRRGLTLEDVHGQWGYIPARTVRALDWLVIERRAHTRTVKGLPRYYFGPPEVADYDDA